MRDINIENEKKFDTLNHVDDKMINLGPEPVVRSMDIRQSFN